MASNLVRYNLVTPHAVITIDTVNGKFDEGWYNPHGYNLDLKIRGHQEIIDNVLQRGTIIFGGVIKKQRQPIQMEIFDTEKRRREKIKL